MPLNLNQTLSWIGARDATSPNAAAELAMLNDLQGNILKGHGRHFTSNIFLRFDPAHQTASRRFVASIGHDITSALDQLSGAQAHRRFHTDAGAFIACMLSATGYDALGLSSAKPTGPEFNAGMAKGPFNDPPPDVWDKEFAGVHGLILVATSDGAWRDAERNAIIARITATGGAVTLTGALDGNALINSDENGIEHFGYVDGRSQPLALQEDVDHQKTVGGIDQWDPSIPLSQLLVKCPGGDLEVSLGSYFVIRKLEQNVKGFKTTEDALADALDAEAVSRVLPQHTPVGERAGGSVIGRFENGTPVLSSGVEVPLTGKGEDAVANNFNFAGDTGGLKCPYAGHIRKSNPRTDVPNSKARLMARRGIPYGLRKPGDDPNDGKLDNKPMDGVGLIFMAYQADIGFQFQFTQQSWVNNIAFATPIVVNAGFEAGIDPVIGQKPNPVPPAFSKGQLYPIDWGGPLSQKPFDFFGFVTMKGGEYFFAPSISFLKSMH